MIGGGVWPVVQREMRAAARWRWGPWLRMGGALGGVLVIWSVFLSVPARLVGTQVIEKMHLLLLALICGFVPAVTADCIASERREGTLGLLFLTPLTATGIVLGKVLAQILRTLTLWLAVLPLLTLPFLLGGLTVADVAGFFIVELCAGLICLAAGILASSLTESYPMAVILAFLLMGTFVCVSGQYQDWWKPIPARGAKAKAAPAPVLPPGTFTLPSGATYLMTNGRVLLLPPPAPVPAPPVPVVPAGGILGIMPARPPANKLVTDFFFAAILFLASFRFAGWCVERSWQDERQMVDTENWIKRYWTSFFQRLFSRRLRRELEWNPIAWLQQYSWKARASKWGLCLLVASLEGAVFMAGTRPYAVPGLVSIPVLIFAVAYASAGVNTLFQEKKSGALELVMVSPLTVHRIIFGRVWGIWRQFLPSVIVLAGSEFALQMMHPHSHNYGEAYWEGNWGAFCIKDLEIVAIYLTLPFLATSFALSARNLFSACALTAAAGFAPAITVLMIPLETNEIIHPPENVLPAALGFSLFLFLIHALSAWSAYKFSCESLGRDSKTEEAAA
jgi:ABC-type Na+ efflux pump permease subunit